MLSGNSMRSASTYSALRNMSAPNDRPLLATTQSKWVVKLLAAALAFSATACGFSGDVVLDDSGQEADRGGCDLICETLGGGAAPAPYLGDFTLLKAAEIEYSLKDNYINSENSWNVAIVLADSAEAFLAREDVDVFSRVERQGSFEEYVSLQPGDYALVVQCQNYSDKCRFDAKVIADYEE
jgi:hypothetical protein